MYIISIYVELSKTDYDLNGLCSCLYIYKVITRYTRYNAQKKNKSLSLASLYLHIASYFNDLIEFNLV